MSDYAKNSSEYIKVIKLSDGSLDPMGLPFWECKYLHKSQVNFEIQTWFKGRTIDKEIYETDCRQHMHQSMWRGLNGTSYATTRTYPNRNDPKYLGEVKLSRTWDELVDPVKVERYFISGLEVSENEFERVASLVGCKL